MEPSSGDNFPTCRQEVLKSPCSTGTAANRLSTSWKLVATYAASANPIERPGTEGPGEEMDMRADGHLMR